uniref:Uncharacterized protein n=1 Tax=Sphaerodactylus townsendi TaxID=933632 RepID=A0ACB8ET04_9SAUR
MKLWGDPFISTVVGRMKLSPAHVRPTPAPSTGMSRLQQVPPDGCFSATLCSCAFGSEEHKDRDSRSHHFPDIHAAHVSRIVTYHVGNRPTARLKNGIKT